MNNNMNNSIMDVNSKVIGVCSCRTRIITEASYLCCTSTQIREAYIMTLGVSSTFRRKGLASRLLRLMHQYLISEFNIQRFTLHCKVDNAAALQFYKLANYSIVERIAAYYVINNKEEDAYFLVFVVDDKQQGIKLVPSGNNSIWNSVCVTPMTMLVRYVRLCLHVVSRSSATTTELSRGSNKDDGDEEDDEEDSI